MKRLMEEGLRQGAVAAGFGMVYTPAATRWEILEMFRMAAKHRASCHVHLRGGSTGSSAEPEAGSRGGARGLPAVMGAPLQVVHMQFDPPEITRRRRCRFCGRREQRPRRDYRNVSLHCRLYMDRVLQLPTIWMDRPERHTAICNGRRPRTAPTLRNLF